MTEKEALIAIEQFGISERRAYLGALVSLFCLLLAIFHTPYWAVLAVFFAFLSGANMGVLLMLKPKIEYLANGGKILD